MPSVAVALIDALGFKGIWRHEDPATVVSALRTYREMARRMNEEVGGQPSPFTFHAQAVSDTLIFATAAPEGTQALEQRMVELLGIILAAVTRNAFLHTLPLAFRGYLSLGEGLLEDGVLVGEAIDEAASKYERADAACVWLSPRAAEVVTSLPAKTKSGYWISTAVPMALHKLREGEPSSVNTVAINPCGRTPDGGEHAKIVAGALHASERGDQTPEVVRKRGNTLAFLNECSRASQGWWYAHGWPKGA